MIESKVNEMLNDAKIFHRDMSDVFRAATAIRRYLKRTEPESYKQSEVWSIANNAIGKFNKNGNENDLYHEMIKIRTYMKRAKPKNYRQFPVWGIANIAANDFETNKKFNHSI